MLSYMPDYYRGNEIIEELIRVISLELKKENLDIDDLRKQFYISTATWGLGIYEKELGIASNSKLSYEKRREMIRAKLRGKGTTTKDMVRRVAESFSGGEVEVEEFPKESYFLIHFVGTLGVPENLEGFRKILEDIKPAHLAYEFKYRYNTWKDVSIYKWSELKHLTWSEAKTYKKED